MKYIIYYISVILTICILTSCDIDDSSNDYKAIRKLQNTLGLQECIQNTYFKDGKYLNFDQYLFVNKNKLENLEKKLNTLKDVHTEILKSDKDGLVESLLSYSIDNKKYRCVFTLDFSKKENRLNVLRYE